MQEDLHDNEQPTEKAKSSMAAYAKYSAIGFQMIAIIGLFTLAGYKIDESRNSKSPIITALLSLSGVLIALYVVIRSFKRSKN